MDPTTRRELDDLLSALLDGELSANQQERLGELLAQSVEAQDRYLAYFELHAELASRNGLSSLALSGVNSAVAHPPSGGNPPAPALPQLDRVAAQLDRVAAQRGGASRRWLAATAIGILGLAAGLLLPSLLPLQQPPRPVVAIPTDVEPTHSNVAVLMQAPGAEWAEPTSIQPGAPLSPGWLHLKAGLAYVQFYSGATVILEGPADFQLISSQRAYCARGKLRANVPAQAQGFTIGSPQLDLVDLGTEFGLRVDGDDATEVHVFQGKVELFDAGESHAGAARTELTAGRGVHVDERGAESNIPSDSSAFLNAQDLAERTEIRTLRHHQEWLAASEALRNDPQLVTYYTFQQPDLPSRWTLENRALSPQRILDGAIVGCSWGAGRWPGKWGLEFKRISDRVRVRVPGDFDALTLMASVRVDSFPNRYAPLLMTEGWEERAPHWHIRQDGTVSLGVQGFQGAPPAFYSTATVFTPERLGQWAHLAVVYDRVGGHVSHFIDGNLVQRMPITLDVPLRIGDAEIGNWSAGSQVDTKYPIRFLSGCIDEFFLFSRALSGDEIHAHYVRGRPPL